MKDKVTRLIRGLRHRYALIGGALLVAAMVVASASVAFAQCGDGDCSVGAAGTGGEKSEGKAQGFRTEAPGEIFPTVTFTNTGNLDAGHFKVTGTVNDQPIEGETSGTFRHDSVRGRSTGIFGDWTGQCPIADFPCDDS